MEISGGVVISGGVQLVPPSGGGEEAGGGGSTDSNFSNVSLLLNGDGSNGSTSFTDLSDNSLTVAAVGDAQVSTSIKKYGTGSIKLDGTGDYLDVTGTTALVLGTGDFTIEGWYYANNFTNRGTFVDSRGPSSTSGITIGHQASSGDIRVYMTAASGSDIVVQSTNFSTGQWTHIAVTRESGTVRLFVNGNLEDSATRTTNLNVNHDYHIGNGSYTGTSYTFFDGYIDDFRITKGVARYTSNFTAPTAALPTSAGSSPAPSPTPSYSFQGSTSGYAAGGSTPSPNGAVLSNVIQKFAFSSDGNATDVGDLTVARQIAAGQSSSASGYTSGGKTSPTNFVNTIDKFPFSSDGNATDVGDMTVAREGAAGQSSSASGYSSGGRSTQFSPDYLNVIDKFPFASDGNATDVGDLTAARATVAGQSSSASGYSSGGAWPGVNIIDKFPFSSDSNATDVGDLTQARGYNAGHSSSDSGYSSGGYGSVSEVNTIDKFPFASDGNASDVGDLTVARYFVAGQSSTSSGYSTGGVGPGNANSDIIDKFPFASDANATDVGDLLSGLRAQAGQQY